MNEWMQQRATLLSYLNYSILLMSFCTILPPYIYMFCLCYCHVNSCNAKNPAEIVCDVIKYRSVMLSTVAAKPVLECYLLLAVVSVRLSIKGGFGPVATDTLGVGGCFLKHVWGITHHVCHMQSNTVCSICLLNMWHHFIHSVNTCTPSFHLISSHPIPSLCTPLYSTPCLVCNEGCPKINASSSTSGMSTTLLLHIWLLHSTVPEVLSVLNLRKPTALLL